MASETFKKWQKETARREKQQKKTARRMERRNERANAGNKLGEEKPAGLVSRAEPIELVHISQPKYFSSSARPRNPKRKSKITLYTPVRIGEVFPTIPVTSAGVMNRLILN
jgi:hypothetical protein